MVRLAFNNQNTMTNVLITGAGGYIGSNVAEYFVNHGFNVTGMVRNKIVERFSRLNVASIQADLYDFSTLPRLFDGRQYDYVIHIGARASDVGRKELFRIANFEAVKHLANLSMQNGVKRFVFLSTSDVYGLRDFHGETEEQVSRAKSSWNYYPHYKILSEEWIESNIPPQRYALVRPFVVWGNDDTSITPRAVDFLKSWPFIVYAGKWRGQNRCALAHVRNVAASLHAAAVLPEMGGSAVHVLDPEHTTWAQYYRMVRDHFLPGKTIREITLPVWTLRPIGKISSMLSTFFNCYVPLFDPSEYALETIIYDTDFSSEKMCRIIEAVGEKVTHTYEGAF